MIFPASFDRYKIRKLIGLLHGFERPTIERVGES